MTSQSFSKKINSLQFFEASKLGHTELIEILLNEFLNQILGEVLYEPLCFYTPFDLSGWGDSEYGHYFDWEWLLRKLLAFKDQN